MRRQDRRKSRTGKKVAVVGSGPSGLAAADLSEPDEDIMVTVFEREDKVRRTSALRNSEYEAGKTDYRPEDRDHGRGRCRFFD